MQQLFRGDPQQRASGVVGADRGGVEREHHRLTERQFQFRLFEDDFLPLFKSLRHDAEDTDLAILFGLRAFDGDVIRSCNAAADAPAAALPQPGVVGGAPGDCQVEGRIREHKRLPGMSRRVVPVPHHRDEALTQRIGLEDPAVEQDRLRRLVDVIRGRGMFSQECSEVAGNTRVADVREAHFVQAAASAAAGLGVTRDAREEAVEEQLTHLGGRKRSVLRAADDLAATPHHRHRVIRRGVGPEQRLLGKPACLGQHAILGGVQASGAGQPGLDEFGNRQIHVVAAEQQMIADGLADEAEFALLFDGLNQAKVTGAAAHIDDQAAGARL